MKLTFKKNALVKMSAVAAGLLVSSASYGAVLNNLPLYCDYGKVNSSSVELSAIPSAIESGFSVYQNPYSGSEWWSFLNALRGLSSSSSFAAEGPDYVLSGVPTRFKGDLDAFDIEDRLRDVSFSSSELGYIGKDKSNWDANAYHDVTFNITRGAGLVWVESGGRCSAKSVWVQEDRPKFIYKSAPYSQYPNNVTVDVGWILDRYSKAGIEGSSSGARIWVSAIGAQGIGAGASKAISSITGSTTISFQSPQADLHSVSVRISDGTFSTGDLYIGRVDVGGWALERPCPTCAPY